MDGIAIVSNVMRFNEDYQVVGFEDPPIHTLSDCGARLPGAPVGPAIALRHNGLLLRGQPGDRRMDGGIDTDRCAPRSWPAPPAAMRPAALPGRAGVGGGGSVQRRRGAHPGRQWAAG